MAKLSDTQKEELKLLSIEVDENNKKRYTQQQLADKYGISKGMVNRYIQPKVNKVNKIIDEEVSIHRDYKKLQEEKSKHLTKSEQIEVNKQIESKLYAEQLVNSVVLSSLLANQQILEDGYVEDKINVGDRVQKFEKRKINTSDTLNIINGTDKASITLGVNQRHANSQINVNTQNNMQQNTVLNKEIVTQTLENFENEY